MLVENWDHLQISSLATQNDQLVWLFPKHCCKRFTYWKLHIVSHSAYKRRNEKDSNRLLEQILLVCRNVIYKSTKFGAKLCELFRDFELFSCSSIIWSLCIWFTVSYQSFVSLTIQLTPVNWSVLFSNRKASSYSSHLVQSIFGDCIFIR